MTSALLRQSTEHAAGPLNISLPGCDPTQLLTYAFLSIHLSTYLPTYIPTDSLSAYLATYLPVCLTNKLSV